MYKRNYQFYVYIISNKKNGTLYIGMTNNMERRMYQHKNGIIDGFSKKYDLKELVYCEFHQYVHDAIKREKQLKNWKRDWKISLIEENNNEWDDLAFDWFD